MSVLHCHIPHFLAALTRHQHALPARPLALLGPDERVWGVSPEAAQSGVAVQMRPQEAQARCPDVLLQPLDTEQAEAAQHAFVEMLTLWELPTETPGWGSAYVDLHTVATGASDVQPLAAHLGQRLRHTLGTHLQPSIGWDSGKFTARAAAVRTLPGHMRLVGKAEEVSFLSPLPVTLLPLEPTALQQLQWLGIRTLGQFAGLPPVAVQQRFGIAGRLAQTWAQGHDSRPVRDGASRAFQSLPVDMEVPTRQLAPVMDALMGAVGPMLGACQERLEGCTELHLHLTFVSGDMRRVKLAAVEPIVHAADLRARLQTRLQCLNWPAALDRITITQFTTCELPTPQLTLFSHPELDEPDAEPPLQPLARKLTRRFGEVFFRGELVEESHPLPEKRSALHGWS